MTSAPVVRIGDVAERLSGFAFKSEFFSEHDGIPIVRIRDVVRGTSETRYRGDYDRSYLISDGEVLIGMDGEFNTARWRGGSALLNQRVCRIRSGGNGLDERYLFHFLPNALKRIEDATPFVTVKHLSVKDIRDIGIPLPSLAHQRRIAAILDQADALRAKRRAAMAQLDTLDQSIFLEMFGNPSNGAGGWPRSVLGDVATFVGGGTPSRARSEFYEGSICWATSKDMKGEFLDDTEEHITPAAIEASATKLVPAGTILVVVKSKVLAHSLPVAIARVPTCFGQDLKGIRVSEATNAAFVATALRLGKRVLLERARGINTEGLTLEHLSAFPLPLPPVDLQRAFAAQFAAIEKLKAAQRASLSKLDELFASLQHRAFRGEL